MEYMAVPEWEQKDVCKTLCEEMDESINSCWGEIAVSR